ANEATRSAYLAARWEFYRHCYDSSGRLRLVREVERLFWRAERYNHRILSTPERFKQSLTFHQSFLAACARHEPELAERIMRDSIAWGIEYLAPLLPSATSFDPSSSRSPSPHTSAPSIDPAATPRHDSN